MKIKRKTFSLAVGFVFLLGLGLQAQPVTPGVPQGVPQGRQMDYLTKVDSNRSIADYFSPSTSKKMTPDEQGFIQRWLLLDPINKPNRSNTVFTDSYIREAFATEYFPNQFTVIPKNGDKVKVGEQELVWQAMDSKLFNVKLFRFAFEQKKTHYGVIFWAVTVVNSPEEMKDVRMAVGSNSASMWWLNGEEAVILSGDRRMVMDDAMSNRLTLKKGKNIIRGAVINGPGMSDFCVRFLDESGKPIKILQLLLNKLILKSYKDFNE